jgi:hypothetical protein
MQQYNFTCTNCFRKWTGVTTPAFVKCARCKGVAHQVIARKRRKDAIKPVFDTNSLNIHSRPTRNARPPTRLADQQMAFLVKELGENDDMEMDVDLPEDEIDDEYVPSADFNPDLRFTSAGEFDKAQFLFGVTKATPWTKITGKAGRGNTAAQFGGESAELHGSRFEPQYHGQPPATGTSRFEWCHLIADSLGGPTNANNLFCGTYHANTAMLCIEKVLRGKTHLEVKIDVTIRAKTELGLIINYQVRNPRSSNIFSKRIDGLATGCTKSDGTKLSGEVRKWVGRYGRG